VDGLSRLPEACGGKNESTATPKKESSTKKNISEDGEMKRLLLCLAILSLLAVPAMADWNWGDNAGIDVQGYVDSSVQYQSGCVDVKEEFCGTKTTFDVNCYGEVTNFDCAANVPSSWCAPTDCGLTVTQDKWDTGVKTEFITGEYETDVNAKYATGSADMTSLGGVAICTNDPSVFAASAQVTNGNYIQNTAQVTSYNWCAPSCSATANYQGSQTLDLSASIK
jgi:hypothetical protein